MRNFKRNKILLLMLAVFLVGACSRGGAIEIGESAKDFTLNDLDGKAVQLSDFKGKAIILNFFATWCPPCRSEIPDFIELENAYASKGFSVIGVSNEDPKAIKGFATKAGINYPVLIDPNDKVYTLYGPIRGIPTTFIIDKDFRIRQMYIGARSKDVFENDIKELLK